MAVIAHPGDEAFGFGGAIAQAAASGAYVVVLCATRGHFDRRLLDRAPAPGGRNRHYSNPTVWRNLDTVREDEMRRSVALLGVRVLRMLDYAEEGLSAVPFDELVGRIVEPIRMHRPEVILTFGPDGVTGDDDHAAIGRATEAEAEFRAGLREELRSRGVAFRETPLFRIELDGMSAHQVLRSIETPLTVVQTHAPSLEDAYLEAVGRAPAKPRDEELRGEEAAV